MNTNGQPKTTQSKRLRTFISSSTEGLPIANKLQMLLDSDLAVEVWNQGTVFGLGDVTLEALERAVLSFCDSPIKESHYPAK
jgi:predicted nucleotide-binding protein